ncbi:MAG: AraC family transcriptional regulator [Gammaproteobacteria bacterium HGW-Gammaproteobacteria-14]|nr:MAG: AraC family transcriptional regulator [Gammaproteobacteria bacterium HGW-Gammaproteobacteria-14]
MKDTLLPASILPGLLEIALKGRLNIQSLFERAGIDGDLVGSAEHFISLSQLDTLLTSAFNQVDDPWFGFQVGRDNHYGNLDLLGNLMATSNTLGDALQCLLVYKNLLVPYLHFDVRQNADSCTLAITADNSLSFTRTRTHSELVMTTMVAIGRSLVGGDMRLRSARFRHLAPEDIGRYQDFFQVPLTFGCSHNELEMDVSLLQVPLATAYPKYHQRLRRLADQQLVSLSRVSGFSGQVLAELERRIGQEDASIDVIAATLRVTPRTLQRRLLKEGVRFIELRDQVRHRRACSLLRSEEHSFAAIAAQLGFADIANFYHAFKRWQGCAPGEYRRELQSEAI